MDLSKDRGNIVKHLVLGSRGQVGAYVVKELLARGEEVIEWDIVIDPKHMDLRIGSSRLLETMQNSDYVHFLACDVGGSKYLEMYQNTYDFISNNVAIMDNVFSMLKITKKPFYFTSSQMSSMSHSIYGNLKAIGEGYTNSLGGTVVRFWNVYGVETDPDKAHVITDFLKMAAEDGRVLCRTNGAESRQFIYAEDVAKILADLSTSHPSNGVVEITNDQWISICEVAETVRNVIGPHVQIYYTTKRDTVQGERRYADYPYQFDYTSLMAGVSRVAEDMGLINKLT